MQRFNLSMHVPTYCVHVHVAAHKSLASTKRERPVARCKWARVCVHAYCACARGQGYVCAFCACVSRQGCAHAYCVCARRQGYVCAFCACVSVQGRAHVIWVCVLTHKKLTIECRKFDQSLHANQGAKRATQWHTHTQRVWPNTVAHTHTHTHTKSLAQHSDTHKEFGPTQRHTHKEFGPTQWHTQRVWPVCRGVSLPHSQQRPLDMQTLSSYRQHNTAFTQRYFTAMLTVNKVNSQQSFVGVWPLF